MLLLTESDISQEIIKPSQRQTADVPYNAAVYMLHFKFQTLKQKMAQSSCTEVTNKAVH